MIISIRGVPGSGKSYIGKKLSTKAVCIDTDDIVTEAYLGLLRAKPLKTITHKQITIYAKKLLKRYVQKYSNSILIVAGILLPVPKADQTFFISMTDAELEAAYNRTKLREIKKYKKVNVDGVPAREISNMLAYGFHIHAVDPIALTLTEYKKQYNDALKGDRRHGAHVLPQKEIIKVLKSYIT